MFGQPFSTTNGMVKVRLDDHLNRLLRSLLHQLREILLLDDGDDIRRLYPTAYPDDVDRQQAYDDLVHDQLLMQRLDAIDTMEATIDNDILTVAEADVWMNTINQIRLVIGTRLDVGEDDDREIDPDDPSAAAHAVYQVMSYLLGSLTDARIKLL